MTRFKLSLKKISSEFFTGGIICLAILLCAGIAACQAQGSFAEDGNGKRKVAPLYDITLNVEPETALQYIQIKIADAEVAAAKAGAIVTVAVDHGAGHFLDELDITLTSGALELTETAVENVFQFTMPSEAITLKAVFVDALSTNNKLSGITASSGVTWDRVFNGEDDSVYTVKVPYDTASLTLTPQKSHPKAKIQETMPLELRFGNNPDGEVLEKMITVKAVNGDTKVYALKIAHLADVRLNNITVESVTNTFTAITLDAAPDVKFQLPFENTPSNLKLTARLVQEGAAVTAASPFNAGTLAGGTFTVNNIAVAKNANVSGTITARRGSGETAAVQEYSINLTRPDAVWKSKAPSGSNERKLVAAADGNPLHFDEVQIFRAVGNGTLEFTGAVPETAWVLVVGGGGGGGSMGGSPFISSGGGGSGGYSNQNNALSLDTAVQSYAITVGDGGRGGANNFAQAGGAGSPSSFGTLITAAGGAGGGAGGNNAGTSRNISSNISGAQVTYASGGAGGTASTGTSNTGNGGGGGNQLVATINPGGKGGSGIVIIRFPNNY